MRQLVVVVSCLVFLAGCGGGGGGGGSAPPAQPEPALPGSTTDDEVTIVENNQIAIDVLSNDSNVVSGTLTISEIPTNGNASVSAGSIVYTPDTDYVGSDLLVYSVDGDDGAGVTGSVSITITAVSITQLEVQTLSIPASDYASANDAELSMTVLASPVIEFDVPPNVVSVVVSLTGNDVNIDRGGLFIRDLTSPSGSFPAFQRFVNFCIFGSCSSLVPRLPGYEPQSGTWSVQLATTSSSLDALDFDDMSLTVAARTGPDVDPGADIPASITVKPFVTATSTTMSDVDDVLGRVAALAEANGFELVVEPVQELADGSLSEVSSDFLDSETQNLVTQGDADVANVFFVESFSAGPGLAGVTGSIPAVSGSKNGFNGTIINAGTLMAGGSEFSLQETAEITFHEIGHLLGLYHTTEAQFSLNDVLDDTPNCELAVHDANDDGTADPTECPDGPNPMFWRISALVDWVPLTDDQKWVIFHSPLAEPGS